MAQKTNLNVAPYYDDFDRNKNFYKVLFRPGYSIQTRELTTLQSVLQEQIERHGNYQFKQGELVIPGEVGLNTKLNYVKLSSVSEVAVNIDNEIVYRKYDISQLIGQTLVGITSGVQAIVLATKYETDLNSDTIFVSYTNSGDSSQEDTFRQGELLEVLDGVNTPILTVGTDGAVLPNFIQIEDIDTGEVETNFSAALGYASAVKIEEGVYFINGYFVRNESQLVILDPYNNKASGKVAFDIIESVTTPEEDRSLYDNSRGSSNFSAPGAHRLKIELVASRYDYKELLSRNSIELLSIKNGTVEKKIKQKEYNVLEETLSRRTYDESGDYVVSDFSFDVREYVQKNGNTGLYSFNGIALEEASQKLVGTIGPGKAYVKGYEIVNKETKYVTLDKARDSITRNNVSVKSSGYSSFYITNVYGSVPVNSEGVELSAYPTVYLFNTLNDGNIGLNGVADLLKNTSNNRGRLISDGPSDSEGNDIELDPSDIGIKTIWIERSINVLPSYVESYLPPIGSLLWVIQSYTQVSGSNVTRTALTNKVRVLSSSLVTNEKVNPGSSLKYAEITITGRRDIVDSLFKDYDIGDESGKRRVFLSSAKAFDVNNLPTQDQNGNPIFPPLTKQNYIWGTIVDYTETITPLVGICKPSNFYNVKDGIGFDPIKDKISSKGIVNGNQIYNGIFNFSFFNPIFFTRIKLENVISVGFGVGKYVTGSKSGAYGVVEGTTAGYYSSTNTLHLKVQQGQFEEGETLIDEDGNTIKIAKSNTVSHFVVHKQGSNYNSGTIIRLNGVSYNKSKISVNRVDDGTQISTITITDRSVRDVEYVNPPVVSLTNGTGALVSAVLFKDTVHTYSSSEVKSFYSEYGSGVQGTNVFTADIVVDDSTYSVYTKISDSTFGGSKGLDYLSVNSLGVDLGKLLKEGDLVQYVQDDGKVVKAIVTYATTSIGNEKARVYLDSALRFNVSNSVLTKINSKIENPNASLIFKTGSTGVSSVVRDITDSKIKYYFRRDFVGSGSSSGGSITFAAQLPYGTQRFVKYTKENFVMTILSPGVGQQVYFNIGDIVYIKPEYVNITDATDNLSGLVAGTATITFPDGYFGSGMTTYPKIKLTATLEVSKAKPKLKTSVTNKRIIVTPSNDKVIPLRGQDYDSADIGVFSFSDVYKLRYIYEGTLASPPKVDANGELIEGKDVTNSFIFDDGQRPTFYDVSRIILKPGESVPTGRLVIGFDYFDHSQGEFCTVDSYIHESGVDISQVPSYNSQEGLISLRDVIDFRPKVDSTVVTSGFQNKTYLSSKDYISFNDAGGAPSVTLASDYNLEYSISFDESSYLDRIDALFLDKSGNFIVKKGNSSKNPSKPDLIEDSIPLYYVYLPALTENSNDVKIIPVDNKRYTMRDISKLEKRIERLEYYTSLSILEQQTLNMQIKDSFGFERFKSGFLVDNFETHGIGNVSSSEYSCAIDTQQSVLRPQVYEDNIKLVELNARKDQRFFDGYVNNNSVVTLPFTSVNLLGNSSATKTINPNPFVVLQYVGEVNLNPTLDQWFDNDVVPLITNNNTNLFNIYLAKSEDPQNAIASIYNSFLINWTGVNQSFASINSLSNLNTNQSQSSSVEGLVSSSSNISPNNNEIAKGVATRSSNGSYVASAIQFFVRSIPVKFVVTRMKPKTRVYPFIDGRDVSRWTIPDSTFSGLPTSSLTSFNSPIITDENGSASGIILIPAGYPPVQGSSWTGKITDVVYDTGSEKFNLVAGQKTIRFSSSSIDASKDIVDSYAEVNYHSRGLKPENPQSIVSTQPSYFKSNEGTQFVDSNTDNIIKPNPLSQTFRIENYEGGIFVTDIDLYFNKKSSNIPIKVYLTDVILGKPGKNIIPGSENIIFPKTFIKIFATGNITIKKGDIVTGVTSGCSGPIEKIIDKNGNEVTLINNLNYNLTNEQVYTFVITNHNGKAFSQNELLTSPQIKLYNDSNNTNIQVRIAKDSGKVASFTVENVGSNYEGALFTIESPQLPGESVAIATPYISDGSIYDVDVSISGSGYTDPPSVVIKGIGNGAGGAVVKTILEIDTPAVRMGVSVDDGTNLDSSTPTKFKFDHPIYLQNNVDYAIQIETDSTEYALWSSRLGEIEKITGVNVSSQPLLGSLYRSQNTDTWVEDLFEDLKFTLNRAKFDISKTANLKLINDSLPYQKLEANPFETSSSSNTNATSDLFKSNNSIIKVNHKNHGYEDSGLSKVFFRNVESFSGLSSNSFVSRLYTVDSVGVDSYTIKSLSQASDSARGGGSNVYATKNIKYEKLYADISFIQTPRTKIDSTVRTTNVVPIDSKVTNYVSYNVSNYETTFLNQEHFFENQKFVTSSINEILNGTGKSLTYNLSLSSEVDHLSPLVDLRNVSVKTLSNRVDNSSGYEDRFGKRYQVVSFWSVYQFVISGINVITSPISNNQTIRGRISGAEGTIISVNGTSVIVRMSNNGVFETGEGLVFSSPSNILFNQNLSIKIDQEAVIQEIVPDFNINDEIVAYNPISNILYNNIIDGKIILWDLGSKELTIQVEKNPINNDYYSQTLPNGTFARNSVLAKQADDIFRINDFAKFDGSLPGTDLYLKIKSSTFNTGIDYRENIEITSTSALSKYLTKEVTINTPATSLDVRITANVKDPSNIIVLYKILESSSQEILSSVKWNYLPFETKDLKLTSTNAISGIFEKREDYQELKYYVNDLSEFTKYAIKIVLKSDNPVYPPKVQDLRVVAST